MDFFPEVQLSPSAAEAIARGLFAVAKADGLHERESALIASFWIDTGGSAAALAELERGASLSPAELASHLHTQAERQLFLKTAMLLAWADGQVTPEERKSLGAFATALGIDAAAVEHLETAVKEFLLGHIAHLSNTDAVRAVAKKLS